MILSHKNKFIFIKTEKTASTSLEVFLSRSCGPDDVLTRIAPQVEPHRARNFRGFYNPLPNIHERGYWGIRFELKRAFISKQKFFNHISARKIRARIPRKIWDSYYKFAVARNPWELILSHFHHMNGIKDRRRNLDEYLRVGRFPKASELYTDKEGGVIVDRVVRYESLLEGLGEVFDRLNIPFEGTLGVHAKGEHRLDRRPYQEVYSPAQRAVVEAAFSKEIELHDYRF